MLYSEETSQGWPCPSLSAQEEACEELRQCSGTQLGPELVAVFYQSLNMVIWNGSTKKSLSLVIK